MLKEDEPIEYEQRAFSFEENAEPAEEDANLRRLRESIAAYVDMQKLRQLAAEYQDLNAALRSETPPVQVRALIDALSALLRPTPHEQIKSPADAAALLMVQMGHLDQEEMRTVLLDSKNRVQDIVTVYRGSLNASLIRVGEVYKAALRRNSASIILAHNHPSGEPNPPSPEDVLVTVKIVEAGELLDVPCLDHLVIGRGKWLSMREKGLGFTH